MRNCECPDWKPNTDYINGSIQFLAIHGIDSYNLTQFKFCPWCGKRLMEDVHIDKPIVEYNDNGGN